LPAWAAVLASCVFALVSPSVSQQGHFFKKKDVKYYLKTFTICILCDSCTSSDIVLFLRKSIYYLYT
jgi:hypothetical protein